MATAAIAQLQRLRSLAASLIELEPDQSDFPERFRILKRRAEAIAGEGKLPRGNPAMLAVARQVSADKRRAETALIHARYLPTIREIRASGAMTFLQVARELDRRGVMPPKAKTWRPNTVRSIELAAEQATRAERADIHT